MSRTIVSTPDAPKAIGPYSQAVSAAAGRLLFCSGQIPLDPTTGEMVGASDVRAQTRQVMQNLSAVLRAGGASFASVVKTTIYLADLADFGTVNEIYGSHFPSNPPARATLAGSCPGGSIPGVIGGRPFTRPYSTTGRGLPMTAHSVGRRSRLRKPAISNSPRLTISKRGRARKIIRPRALAPAGTA